MPVRHRNRGGSAVEDIRLGECMSPASTDRVLELALGMAGCALMMLPVSLVVRILGAETMLGVVTKEAGMAKRAGMAKGAGRHNWARAYL